MIEPLPLPGPVVSVEWLKQRLGHPDLVVFDASWYLPDAKRNGRLEFDALRIPGAQFFDFDTVLADKSSGLPHMLPSAEVFEAEMRRLGVNGKSTIVCYDGAGVFSAPRAWWMLKAFGHDAVAVLDGGLPAWVAAGGETETGEPAAAPAGDFTAKLDRGRLADIEDVKAAISVNGARVLDARGAARFSGEAPEPRPGLRSGHMPGARNLPYTEVVSDGQLKTPAELREIFAARAVSGNGPVITTCGSGVTAAVLALALEQADLPPAAVYDGSWAEWGSHEELPVEMGPDA